MQNSLFIQSYIWYIWLYDILIFWSESQVAESRYHYAPCEDLTDAVMDYMDYTDRRHSADIHGLVKNLTGIDYKDIQLMTELVCDFVGEFILAPLTHFTFLN